jgi:hypothetical protein
VPPACGRPDQPVQLACGLAARAEERLARAEFPLAQVAYARFSRPSDLSAVGHSVVLAPADEPGPAARLLPQRLVLPLLDRLAEPAWRQLESRMIGFLISAAPAYLAAGWVSAVSAYQAEPQILAAAEHQPAQQGRCQLRQFGRLAARQGVWPPALRARAQLLHRLQAGQPSSRSRVGPEMIA